MVIPWYFFKRTKMRKQTMENVNKIQILEHDYYEKLNNRQRNNYHSVLGVVSKNGYYLDTLPEQFKNDKTIVLAAVSQTANVLEHVSSQFKNDKDVVLAAVKNNGNTLQYASDNMRNNYDVVFTAISDFDFSFCYASEELQNHPTLLEFFCNSVPENYHTNLFYIECQNKLSIIKEHKWLEEHISINSKIVDKISKF